MDLIKDWLNENVYHTSSCDKTRKHGHEPCICGKSDTITKIEQLQAENKELLERIELAVDYLPECPDKAKSFLEPAMKEKQDG